MKRLLPLVFISLSSHANDLDRSYSQLNEAYSRCSNLEEKANFTGYKNTWLLSLSDRDQMIVLRQLSRAAYNDCIKPESKDFTYELVEVAIKTGNHKPLDDYIKLMQPTKSQIEWDRQLGQIDNSKIKQLSKGKIFKAPFNALQAFEQIHGKEYQFTPQ